MTALFLAAAPAHADEIDDFVFAQSAYANGDYDVAVRRFEALLTGNAALRNPALVSAARRYYASALVLLNRRPDAERQFQVLLREDPDAQIDARTFSADVTQLFDQVRAFLGPELAQIRAARQRSRVEAQRRRDAERQAFIDVASRELSVVRAPRWPMFVPFGVGQFVNGDAVGGGVLLGAQALLAGATAVTYLVGVFRFPRVCYGSICMRGDLSQAPLYYALEVSNVLSASLLAATALVGIIHANITYRPERTEVRRRALPPDLLQRLQFSVLPMPDARGASLAFALAGRF